MMRGVRRGIPVLGLFMVAAAIRLWRVGAFTTFDEPHWTADSVHFLHALLAANWEETLQFPAPGVPTMWAAALAIFVKVWVMGHGWQAWQTLLQAPPVLPLGNPEFFQAAGVLLPAERVPVALLNALRAPMLYALLVRFGLRQRAAFLAAALAALDPYVIGNDRVVHTDGPTATFFLPALLALMVALERPTPSKRWLALAGVLTAGAVLSKTTGGLVALAQLVLIAAHAWRHRLPAKVLACTCLTWAAAAAIAALLMWPALLVDPVGTAIRVIERSRAYATSGHPVNFFLGEPYRGTAPGLAYYPLSLALRTTPVVWVGILLAAPLVARRSREGMLLRTLVFTTAIYLAGLSLSASKFERYALPVFPLLTTAAALGWSRCLAEYAQHRRLFSALGVGLLVAAQGGSALSDHPYYLRYANPLLGGQETAVRWFGGGWGEGMEQVAAYLREKGADLIVAFNFEPALAPQLEATIVPLRETTFPIADYAVVYVLDRQMEAPEIPQVTSYGRKVFVAQHRGVVLAEVYKLPVPSDHRRFLAEEVPPGDVVVGTAPFSALRYDHSHHVVLLHPDHGQQGVYAALGRLAAAGTRRIWTVTMPQGDHGLHETITEALDVAAWRVYGPVALSFGVEARGYVIPPDARFRPTEPSRPLNVVFGSILTAEAAGISSSKAAYPQVVEVVLRWHSDARVEQNLTAFVHVLDVNGHLWAQDDVLLRDDRGRPTRYWEPGTTAVTRHRIRVPAGIPPGTYALVMGVYDESVTRLSAVGLGSTTVLLGSLEILPPAVLPDPSAAAPPVSNPPALAEGVVLWYWEGLPDVMRPGQTASLRAVWWARATPRVDLDALFALVNEDGKVVQQWTFPVAPYPSRLWRQGEVVQAIYDLRLPPGLTTGRYALHLSLRKATDGAPEGSGALLGTVEVHAREHVYSLPDNARPIKDAIFGENIALAGSVVPDGLVPGETFTFTLFWQAQTTPHTEYKVFVHLVDDAGRIVAQADHVPQNGEAPTTGWLPGEIVADPVTMDVPAGLEPGTYTLLVGLYDNRGERLSLPSGDTAYAVARFTVP